MAPRTSGGKKRRSRDHRNGDTNGSSSRYRNRGTAAPTTSYLYDDDEDDQDNAKIQFLGLTLPNPIQYIRTNNPNINNFFSSTNLTPTRIILIGGLAAMLLAPLFDSFIQQSLTYLRGSSGSAIEDENGVIGDALPHVTNDGSFHGRYPNSLLTLFYPYTLFRDVVLDQPVE